MNGESTVTPKLSDAKGKLGHTYMEKARTLLSMEKT